ncbi:hypothetical protein BDU57DRAFT_512022 [Ampelomyces quisqualis]|uniref:Uncharacterized protein n=1 Tax=Ampelomyces quisqualis TaxID=50730 RepID=A0A6A5QX46_AMPQU|nr:hypothetical protein BDU57DRAFT_512022 [Ampelomyces quisqualis]
MHFTTLITTAALFSSLPYCYARTDDPISDDVFATFWSAPNELASQEKAYNVKEDTCIILNGPAKEVIFKGGKDNKHRIAENPMCLHFYDSGHCPDDNPDGDYTFQYQHVRILRKPRETRYIVGDGRSQPTSLKWTRGPCSHPEDVIPPTVPATHHRNHHDSLDESDVTHAGPNLGAGSSQQDCNYTCMTCDDACLDGSGDCLEACLSGMGELLCGMVDVCGQCMGACLEGLGNCNC